MTLKLNGTNSEAAPAYAGDDADTGLQCGTNELKLVTGGTARVTVNSSGRLSSEGTSQLTHKYTGASNPVLFGQYNSSGDASINNQANAPLLFATNNTEAMRILSDGTIRLASGCPGIDFSGIQTNAPLMTSETLDSYEEGTFDSFANVGGSFTGESIRCARYTRIGNMVYCDLRVQWTGTTGSSSGLAFDLPFVQAGTTTPATGHTGIVFYQGTSVDASAICTHVSKGSSQVSFYHTDGGSGFVSVALNNVNGSYDWIVSFSYLAA